MVQVIDLIHKSQHAPVPYPTMLHSEQKLDVHISVLNGALWDVEELHYGICEIGNIIKNGQQDLVRYHSTSRDQSRYAPNQWETSLQCNDVSHWLGAYLD